MLRDPRLPHPPAVSWDFGRLSAVLADLSEISHQRRTTFQARLKNFHRLGFPATLQTTKGRAASYGPGEVAMMALAVELTQLGLPPERIVRALTVNWFPVIQALRMGAVSVLKTAQSEPGEDPLAMFLFFDPASLSQLREDEDQPFDDGLFETFFYGGQGVVTDNIVAWTAGRQTSRISLVNVTSLLTRLSDAAYEDSEPARSAFLRGVEVWAEDFESIRADGPGLRSFLLTLFRTCLTPSASPDTIQRQTLFFAGISGLERRIIEPVLSEYWQERLGR